MALHPFNINARKIFGRIYRNSKIDLAALKSTLDDQLHLYLDHLSTHLQKPIDKKDYKRILEIIGRNNEVGEILDSSEYRHLVERKKHLLGPIALGLIFCIDGRIPAIFLGGRFASHWEVPAAELKVVKRKSDGQILPESNELCEALRKIVTLEKDLLEIVLAHTSLLNPSHGCGAMAAKRKSGEVKADSLEEANLELIRKTTIPAISTLYNEFRVQNGLEPLKKVALEGLYDTDSFGIILNYEGKDKGLSLSTTDLTNKYKDRMDEFFIKFNLVCGSFSEKFTDLKYLIPFSKNVLKITEDLLENKDFSPLREEVEDFITKNYPDLTETQQKAFRFFLIRTIAFQYLAGCTNISKKTLHHPFAHHEEGYMAVSTRGMVLGKFDPKSQGFSSTPSGRGNAVSFIKTKISIMNLTKKTKDPYLLFICNPVNKRDLTENSIQLHKIMDANAELFRFIVNEGELGKMIQKGELLLIPVLIDEDTREVLKVINHSAYI